VTTPPAGDDLTTARLWLRALRPTDAVALSRYRSDPATARFQSWTTPFTVQDAVALIDDVRLSDPKSPGWYQYGIVLRETDSLIGDLGVNLAENRQQAEIGFTLAAPFRGNGYASEAVGRILDHLFDDRGLHRVSAECDARNLASARLLERTGFVLEGRRREHTFIKGEWTDDLLFGILAGDRSPGPRKSEIKE